MMTVIDANSRNSCVPTSQIFGAMLGDTGSERVTLGWLLGNLQERSFGILLLLLGLVGMVPGVSTIAGVLLLIPAVQMMLARPEPVVPDFIGARRVPAKTIARLLLRVTPVLRWLEQFTHPRWQTPFRVTQRVVGLVVGLLALTLMAPIPFSNILPAIVIMLIAFAFLERDGVLLSVALALAAISIVITAVLLWAGIVLPQLL